MVSDERVAGVEAVLTAHAVVTWEDATLSVVRSEEVVLPPSVVDSGTAPPLALALAQKHCGTFGADFLLSSFCLLDRFD